MELEMDVCEAESFDYNCSLWKHGNMINLFQTYTCNDEKHSGATAKNFERKFMLFVERRDQADIPKEDWHGALSTMWKGYAFLFYFD